MWFEGDLHLQRLAHLEGQHPAGIDVEHVQHGGAGLALRRLVQNVGTRRP